MHVNLRPNWLGYAIPQVVAHLLSHPAFQLTSLLLTNTVHPTTNMRMDAGHMEPERSTQMVAQHDSQKPTDTISKKILPLLNLLLKNACLLFHAFCLHPDQKSQPTHKRHLEA
jgi:hypothetical protein